MAGETLGYYLMRRDDPITYVEFTPDGTMIGFSNKIINEELAPIQDRYQEAWLKQWWSERSIPIEQDNISRFLRKNGYSGPGEYLIKNLGLSLTDYYWIKPIDSDLTWAQVNLYDNDFKSNLLSESFEADQDEENHKTPFYSPNGSLQGTIEKTWSIINGKRFLIKGNHSDLSTESMNEMIACEIHSGQGKHKYAKYKLVRIKGKEYDYGCCSELFTSQHVELVSAWALYTNQKKPNGVSSYDHLLNMCQKFGMDREAIRQWLDYQIMADFVMSGHDRHLNNIAFLRDADSLKFIGPAPIFDSGGAMFAGKAIPKTEKELLNLETHSFRSKEIELVKLVREKSAIDLTKLPPASFIKELYEKDTKMHEKDINNIAHWYEKKIDICRSIQIGQDPAKKIYAVTKISSDKATNTKQQGASRQLFGTGDKTGTTRTSVASQSSNHSPITNRK